MPHADPRNPAKTETQILKELENRHKILRDKKIIAESDSKNATRAMEELKAEALKKYGTDDVAKLQTKLTELKDQNVQKLNEYQESLAKIERDLAEVEARFRESNPAPGDGGQNRR